MIAKLSSTSGPQTVGGGQMIVCSIIVLFKFKQNCLFGARFNRRDPLREKFEVEAQETAQPLAAHKNKSQRFEKTILVSVCPTFPPNSNLPAGGPKFTLDFCIPVPLKPRVTQLEMEGKVPKMEGKHLFPR